MPFTDLSNESLNQIADTINIYLGNTSCSSDTNIKLMRSLEKDRLAKFEILNTKIDVAENKIDRLKSSKFSPLKGVS